MYRYTQILAKTGRTLANGSARQCSHYKPVTMNDIPTPAGSWKAHHDANNRRYNLQLLAGVIFMVITLGYGVKDGSLYLSAEVPKLAKD